MEKRLKKLQIEKKILFISCCIAFAQIACVKNMSTQPLTPSTSTIGQIIQQGTNLSILDSAMSKSGLLATLDSTNSGGAPFTLFAPVNTAFMNAGIYDSNIAKDSVSYLRRLMAYHLYAGNANTVADWYGLIGNMRNYPIQSASGDYFYLTIDSTGFYVNGYAVTQTDVIAKNGVIQALSGVLIPPNGSIYQTLVSLSTSSDTSLSFIVAAIQRASQGFNQINLTSLLSSSGQYIDSTYTFFAPTNAAFMAIGDSSIAAIQQIPIDSLNRLLLTNIIPGQVFSSDFPLDSVRFSYAGDSLFFSTILGNTITSVGDSSISASIIQTNILATNGLIHIVNQILYPYSPF
jgi:uncharacterized surface protein with fasciclin (FAS1) repeats